MENFYTAYTKSIDGKVHYFVKKFIAYPELKDVPPFLESSGMHTDFNKACSIAGLNDARIKQQLLEEIDRNVPLAKVIELDAAGFEEKRKAQ
jgi:hypothetical protein